MTKNDLQRFIKDLSPELMEKAGQCKTIEEMKEFIAENDAELSEEALELISGGVNICGQEDGLIEMLVYNGTQDLVYKGKTVKLVAIQKNMQTGVEEYYMYENEEINYKIIQTEYLEIKNMGQPNWIVIV